MVNPDLKEKMMNKKTLHPDEIIKLYPKEEIDKMPSEQVDIILRTFIASLTEHSIDSEETIEEITDILDDCVKRKEQELLEYFKNRKENNNE